MKKIALAMAIALLFTGCARDTKEFSSIPLVPQMSSKEAIDYYAKALSFDSVTTKNVNVYETKYELLDVREEVESQLEMAVAMTEGLLKQTSWEYSEDTERYISEETYNYVKSMLNDKRIVNGNILSVKQALGFYFVDVEYEVEAGDIGKLQTSSALVGLPGIFREDYKGEETVNTSYLAHLVERMNKHYEENRISKYIKLNIMTLEIEQITDPVQVALERKGSSDSSDTDWPEDIDTSNDDEDETGDDINPGYEEEPAPPIEDPEDFVNEEQDEQVEVIDLEGREWIIDTDEFMDIIGSSTSGAARVPRLDMVFQIPESVGQIEGWGIYPSGGLGLTKFGFDRSKMNGTMKLRYVYKTDPAEPSKLQNVNIYVVRYEIKTGINTTTENAMTPEFVRAEIERLVEEADRAIVNNDITALMSGDIYADPSMAIMVGHMRNSSNLFRNISTVRRVMARNENTQFLVETETVRQDGAYSSDTFATYRDKYYMVVEQNLDGFHITDWVMMSRELTTEPEIFPDGAILKRLIALNLAGDVNDDTKREAERLMNDLYLASTFRVLYGPYEVKDGDETRNIAKGMYDCFNSDPALLPSSRLEYINSEIRDMLIAHGVGTPATYKGVITEFIGGTDSQVEFTTEEYIAYTGRDNGIYMQKYYLVSNIGGRWTIDEVNTLEQRNVVGEELENLKQRIQ